MSFGGRDLHWAETTHQNRPKRPILKPDRKRPSRNNPRPKRLETKCATSALLRQGSDRYIGHWPVPSSRATESIAANIAIRETLSSGDNIS